MNGVASQRLNVWLPQRLGKYCLVAQRRNGATASNESPDEVWASHELPDEVWASHESPDEVWASHELPDEVWAIK